MPALREKFRIPVYDEPAHEEDGREEQLEEELDEFPTEEFTDDEEISVSMAVAAALRQN